MMTVFGYMPKPRIQLEDPLAEYADFMLFEWAVGNGHSVDGDKCACGAQLSGDDAIRAHWQHKRNN